MRREGWAGSFDCRYHPVLSDGYRVIYYASTIWSKGLTSHRSNELESETLLRVMVVFCPWIDAADIYLFVVTYNAATFSFTPSNYGFIRRRKSQVLEIALTIEFLLFILPLEISLGFEREQQTTYCSELARNRVLHLYILRNLPA